MDDDLLEKMTGNWHIERKFSKRSSENTAKIEWVLDRHWLRIDMKDVAKPSKYEAHVYITKMQNDGSYSIHWLDTFGGTIPESLGVGHRDGNSIVFSWKESDGEMKNTFAWHPDTGTWTSDIEQTDAQGKWGRFCLDTYTKAH